MKKLIDESGRFPYRLHYEKEELDSSCEDLMLGFLLERYEEIKFPVSTDDLEVLVEQNTFLLDTYAKLDSGIEGMTEFVIGKKPNVYISEKLGYWKHNNRRRTTLTHELGHVKFHYELFQDAQKNKFITGQALMRCKRENIIGAKFYDWLEWQAGYASGAYLMPKKYVNKIVCEVHDLIASDDVISMYSSAGFGVINRVMKRFSVSKDAAKVRLLQLGYISDKTTHLLKR